MQFTIVIIIAIVCIIVGMIIAFLAQSLRGPAKPDATHLTEGLDEIAHLWRDRQNQGLVVGILGQLFRAHWDMTTEQQQYLETSIKELEAWRSALPPQPETEPASPLPAGLPEVPAVQSVITEPPPVPVQEEASQPIRRPSINPFQVMVNALKADVRTPPPSPPKSIAALVDEVLQEKMRGTPFASQGIRLLDSPDQGLVVMVGMERYNGVDEVPDEGIRNLIREAVSEWGNRASKTGKPGVNSTI
jgi:hypothetical protein